MRDHDIMEFAEIIKRHGLWTRDLRYLGKIFQERLPLDLDDEPVAGVLAALPVEVLETVLPAGSGGDET